MVEVRQMQDKWLGQLQGLVLEMKALDQSFNRVKDKMERLEVIAGRLLDALNHADEFCMEYEKLREEAAEVLGFRP